MLNKSNHSSLILIFSICLLSSVPNVSYSIDSCQTVAGKLANLDTDKGAELINSRVNKHYSKLYKECDQLNTFKWSATANFQPTSPKIGKKLSIFATNELGVFQLIKLHMSYYQYDSC